MRILMAFFEVRNLRIGKR